MKLSYRGVNYELNPTFIEVTERENFGKYRGLPIRTASHPREHLPQSILKLTYRGNNYIGLY
ncbi:DUF4278 domain-containing protein [Microseira wollei]|uniref:DUF4278 domain-containing protein n=1 Tax=Microseira wollei NIES-4236 TaxID=2530354 RepID=A0AAV3XQU5_9CYAN|nr:DUF4278 domain-containing protein [Microseira wollei]GET43184.1 hypothetical protein MiSe_80050 [Microseira wollei NIES-4236]